MSLRTLVAHLVTCLFLAACGTGTASIDQPDTGASELDAHRDAGADTSVSSDVPGDPPDADALDTTTTDTEIGADTLGAFDTGADTGPEAPPTEIYVATTGNDSDPGTLAAPLASLDAARDRVRDIRAQWGLPAGGVTVWLRGGRYLLDTSVVLGAQDSGEPGAPITYRGFPGEDARLIGGAVLSGSAFSLVPSTDPMYNALDPSAQGRVHQIDLGAQGLTDYGTLVPRGFGVQGIAAMELFSNDERLPLGRWPDPGFTNAIVAQDEDVVELRGTVFPDVMGTFVKNGTQDGVNAYARQGLVDGKQYYLYRHTWDWQGQTFTAWFITTATSGFPPTGDPRWHRYDSTLGTFEAKVGSGAEGDPTVHTTRWINHGYAHIDRGVSRNSFVWSRSRPPRWVTAPDPWLHGYFVYDWADLHTPLADIDLTNQVLTLGDTPPLAERFAALPEAQTYYAYNLLMEITVPGEWYLNRSTGILYLWPRHALASSELLVSTLSAPLVRIDGASHIALREFTVEVGRDVLVRVSNSHHIELRQLTLRHAGTTGLALAATDSVVDHCELYDMGNGAMGVSGGDRVTLTPANNRITNNLIRDFSVWQTTYAPGISLSGVGTQIANNEIHAAPHFALSFGGNDHTIERNDIHDVCQFTGDASAIYAGRSWGNRGTTIRHNFIHDIETWAVGHGVSGIYMDDCMSGVEIAGNIIVGVNRAAILHGGGRDVIMHNNVISDVGVGLHTDSRGTTRINNLPGDSWNMLEKLSAGGIDWKSDPWASAYPALAAIPDSWAVLSDPAASWLYPQGSVYTRNISYNAAFPVHEIDAGTLSHFATYGNNLLDSDPLFVDPAALDMNLQPSSPAFGISGFQPIPFDQIGIQPLP